MLDCEGWRRKPFEQRLLASLLRCAHVLLQFRLVPARPFLREQGGEFFELRERFGHGLRLSRDCCFVNRLMRLKIPFKSSKGFADNRIAARK